MRRLDHEKINRQKNIGQSKISHSLSRYFDLCASIPQLSQETEQALARSWRDHGDREALHQLICAHLRQANGIARRYRGYGYPLGDLVGEANCGLMQAALRFNPDNGARFSSYAAWWIRSQILEYVVRNASLVKMGTTQVQKTLFFNLRKLQEKLGQPGQTQPDHELLQEIATTLDVRPEEVRSMAERMGAGYRPDLPLWASSGSKYVQGLAQGRTNPEDIAAEKSELRFRREVLTQAMDDVFEGKASARAKEIFLQRYLSDDPEVSSLDALSDKHHVSRERIRQIAEKSFERVQSRVAELVPVRP